MLVFEKFSGESVCILVLGTCIEGQTAVKTSASVYLDLNQTHSNIFLKYFNCYIHNGIQIYNKWMFICICVYAVFQNHL